VSPVTGETIDLAGRTAIVTGAAGVIGAVARSISRAR
jgi:NAD(P)-dependent dehydrogenase (short-subunit alcohol dehydrogenase family)